MKDEIKEIYLSNLEWTKTHNDIGGVMGNVIFKNNISYEEYNKLLKSSYFILCDKDYITNLEQENKRIKKIAHKMHTWIFLHTFDEKETYDELGLTDEENAMLGYSGRIEFEVGDGDEE